MSFLLILFFNCLIFNSLIQGAEEEDLPNCSDIYPCCTCLNEENIQGTEATMPELENIINLAKNVKEKIFGQDKIVDKVCDIVKTVFVVGEGKKPMVILLGGESGCGKTALVEAICQCLYGKDYETYYEKFSMEALQGDHSCFTFTGSPNGYEGREGAAEQICKKKKNIILFDEIDRAHKNVHEAFLNFIENGKITTGRGKTCSLPKRTIIFMTTNAGCTFFGKYGRFNYLYPLEKKATTDEDIVRIALKLGMDAKGKTNNSCRGMSDALLDRIQNIFVMRTVDDDDAKKKLLDNCIKEEIEEINSAERNFELKKEENLSVEGILNKIKKEECKEISMRKIKDKIKQEITTTFALFKLKNENFRYNGPKKTIKLKWENDKFKCEEEGNENEAENQ